MAAVRTPGQFPIQFDRNANTVQIGTNPPLPLGQPKKFDMPSHSVVRVVTDGTMGHLKREAQIYFVLETPEKANEFVIGLLNNTKVFIDMDPSAIQARLKRGEQEKVKAEITVTFPNELRCDQFQATAAEVFFPAFEKMKNDNILVLSSQEGTEADVTAIRDRALGYFCDRIRPYGPSDTTALHYDVTPNEVVRMAGAIGLTKIPLGFEGRETAGIRDEFATLQLWLKNAETVAPTYWSAIVDHVKEIKKRIEEGQPRNPVEREILKNLMEAPIFDSDHIVSMNLPANELEALKASFEAVV